MKFVLIFLFLILSAGCNSPLNHRLTEPEKPLDKSNATGLNFQTQALKVEKKWLEGPFGNVKKKSILIVYFYNAEQKLTDIPTGLSLNFFATMPSMGHPMDRPGYFEKISQGIYINREIVFNMVGEWEMQLSLDTENETLDTLKWLETF